MSLTVVIPFFNGHDTIQGLVKTIPDGIDVLIVDDLSDQPLVYVDHPRARIIRLDKKGYFTGAVNRGLSESKTDVLILNQDTHFTGDGWLTLLEEKKQEYGLIGEGVVRHPSWPNGYIHGTFMFIRRDVIDTVGQMDARLYPLWGSTCLYQLQACRAGFRALPLKNGSIPGFVHHRKRGYGSAIQQILKREGNKGLFLRTPPRISVIITCRHYGAYLEDAVNSLIGGKTSLGHFDPQTFPSFDVIIVDDASKDDSLKEAQRLADDWKGIKVIGRDVKGGTPAALNTGISSTRAHYITHLCADDMMASHRLKTLHDAAEKYPHSVIYDNLLYFQWGQMGLLQDSRFPDKRTYELGDPGIPDRYDFEHILNKNGMHTGIFYPRKAWEEVGGYSEIMRKGREDWQFNIALGIKGWCGVKASPGGYLYRREKQNRTLTNTTPKHRAMFKRQIMSLYPEIFQGVRPVGCCGGSKKSATVASNTNGTKGVARLPGSADGFVMLEYIGPSQGIQTWYANNTRYNFGLSSPLGYVAKGDAEILLKTRKNRKPVFKLVKIKPVEAPIEEIPYDPADYTVGELMLDGYSQTQLIKLAEAEQAGKGRKGAIGKISEVLKEEYGITQW